MGNILLECRRCEVCTAPRYCVDQCELYTDVLSVQPNSGPGVGSASRHAGGGAVQEGGRAGQRSQEYQPADMSEADMIQQALRISRLEAERGRHAGVHGGPQGSDAAGMANSNGSGPLLGEEDPSLMAAIAASYASGYAQVGQQSEEELVAAAVRKSKMEEENRQRARLREEQAAEYEESLRIDREREAEKALRLKEEEEARQHEAAEQEAKKREAARKQSEAEEAERVRTAKVLALVEEARQQLMSEPAIDEPNRVQVLVKAPDGRRLTRAFRAGDPMMQVYHYVNTEGGEVLAGREYRLVSTMPRVVFEDRHATLEAAGLQGKCTLLVEIIDD